MKEGGVQEQSDKASGPKGFWARLPVASQAIAAVLTALTGLVAALAAFTDVFSGSPTNDAGNEQGRVHQTPSESQTKTENASAPIVRSDQEALITVPKHTTVTITPHDAEASQPANAATSDDSRDILIRNSTDRAITLVYVSRVSEQNWGQDLLGSEIISAGRSLEVAVPISDCLNEVSVQFADGTSSTGTINLCSSSSIEVLEAGLRPR